MQIETTRFIAATPDAVWQVLGEEFGDIAEWAGAVLESSVDGPVAEGTTRTCLIKAKRPFEVDERLVYFDRETRALTYRVTAGVPGMMKRLENAWTVQAQDGGSLVRTVVTLEVTWWALPMLPVLRSQLAKDMAGLTSHLETRVLAQPAPLSSVG
jgi:hypothetical protein